MRSLLWRPITAWFSFCSSELRFIDTKSRCNGPSKPGAHYLQLHRDCPVLLQQRRHLRRTGKEFTTKMPFTESWQFAATWSIIICVVYWHYFEIGTRHSSKWNSTSHRFSYATHLVWLHEWHLLQLKELWLQEEWLFPLDIQYSAHVLVPAQV
jgi:hypothetical protein